jgi:tetratricopeptide (TPR) repeat protein
MKGWIKQGCDRKSLAQLKGYLARGIPAVIGLPLTPYGHQLPLTHELMLKSGAVKGVTLGPEGPNSGNIGRIIALEDVDKFTGAPGAPDPLTESVYQAWRVAIGYDNERRMMILNDPSFGPAWEVPYEQFEAMWDRTGHGCAATYPPNFEDIQAKRTAGPYRPRTPQERAAEHYVYGYALASTRKLKEAEEQFREGLSIPEIGRGYEELLYYELALDLRERNDIPGAIEAARKATEALPEDANPWGFLGKTYLLSQEKDARRKSTEANKRAEALMKDQRAQQIVASTIPSDFWIQPLGSLRGWAAP